MACFMIPLVLMMAIIGAVWWAVQIFDEEGDG